MEKKIIQIIPNSRPLWAVYQELKPNSDSETEYTKKEVVCLGLASDGEIYGICLDGGELSECSETYTGLFMGLFHDPDKTFGVVVEREELPITGAILYGVQ